MEEFLEQFPESIKEAVSLAKGVEVKGDYDKILVFGMGGSGIAGSILADYIKKMPVFVLNSYNLPEFIDRKTLAFASSYSGNTEEPLEMFRQAKERGIDSVIVTSNGKFSKKHGKKIMLPAGLPPRCSLGYQFFSILAVLQNSGIVGRQDKYIEETVKLLDSLDKRLPEKLANRLMDKIPVIYGSDAYSGAVYRWRTQFNENGKAIAHSHLFPEMNHNEINADYRNGKFGCVFLRDRKDHPRIRKRMDITIRIIGRNAGIHNVEIRGKSLLARLFYAVHFGDWTSYYLARLRGVDPGPVPVIEDFKKQLNR